MNERRKTEGKKDTTLFLIVKMSVTLPQGDTENLSPWDFQGRQSGVGRGKGQVVSRVPGMFYPPGPTWSYPMDADISSGISHSTRESDWTPRLWASSSHLPSLSNKGTSTSSVNLLKQWPESSGPKVEGQPWSPRRGRGNRKTTKACGSEEATKSTFFFFFFLVAPAWLYLGPELYRTWVTNLLWRFLCVFMYIRFNRRPERGPGAKQALPPSWLYPPRGQEGCWREAPAQTREARGRKGPQGLWARPSCLLRAHQALTGRLA